jgi:hypothetical protein
MRVAYLGFFGALSLAAVLPGAGAAPSAPSQATLAPAAKSVMIAQKCEKGYRWVPAGYAKHGKWRAARCVPNG